MRYRPSMRRLAMLAAAVAMVTCSRKGPDVGGLELEIINDGSISVDVVHVDITAGDNARVLLSRDYRIPEEATLPNTVGITSNGDPTATVAIAVSAYHLDAAGVRVPLDRRDHLVTQIPTDRVVALRVVLSASCAAHVKANPSTGDAQSNCGTATTCNPGTGQCASSTVSAAVDLQPYTPGDELAIGPPDATCAPEPKATTCAKVQCGTTKNTCAADVDCGGCHAAPAASCADSATRRTYAPSGTCGGGTCSYPPTDSACGSNLQCSSGVCSCASDQYRCTGDALEKCKADRTGFALAQTCMPSRCDAQAKDCDLCVPGTDRCVNGARERCDATGQTWAANACAGAFVCVGTGAICVDPVVSIGGAANWVTLSPDGSRVYATIGSSVKVIDTATATLLSTIPALAGAGVVLVSADGKTLYASYGYGNGSYEVTRIDVATGTQTGHCPVNTTWGSDALALSPDGSKLYATMYPYGPVTQIDVATFTTTGKTYAADTYDNTIKVSPNGSQIWVGNHSGMASAKLRVIDVAAGTVTSLSPPDAVVVFSLDGTRAYVRSVAAGAASVVEINAATLATVSTTPLGVNAQGSMALSPDGKHLVITNNDSGSVMVMDAMTKAILKTITIASPYGVAVGANGIAFVGTPTGVVLVPLP